MSRFFPLSLLSLALLSGCTQSLYHQVGKTTAQRDADLTRCEASALKQAPVANAIRYTPPQREERRICDANGDCIVEHYWTAPVPYTVDTNLDLRLRLNRLCMTEKGYQLLELPSCRSGQPVQVPSRMTAIGANACVLRDSSGQLQIATPG